MKTLAESDRGSWFNQEEQWQSNDSTSIASSLSLPSSSTRKLKASKQSYFNDSFTASSDSETDYSGSSEEISVTFTSVILPMRQQNKIYSRTNILSKRVCLLVFPSSLSASVVSVRLLLCADDYEVSLPCLLLRLAGIFPVF